MLRQQHIDKLGLTFQIHDPDHKTTITPNKTNQSKAWNSILNKFEWWNWKKINLKKEQKITFLK
jgi:hypothetical protein